MRRRDLPDIEVIGDLAEGPASLALSPDVVYEVGRDSSWPPSLCRLPGWLSRPPPFGEQSLELVDGDEPRAPRHFNRLDQRQDAMVECRTADAERLGSLRAVVGEPLDALRLSDDLARCRGRIGRCVPARFLTPTSQATARHLFSVHK